MFGKILYIDLSKQDYKPDIIEESVIRKFIGVWSVPACHTLSTFLKFSAFSNGAQMQAVNKNLFILHTPYFSYVIISYTFRN